MANNELSGPVVTMALSIWINSMKNRRYSYRILFLPETIGSIAYLSKNIKEMKEHVIGGYVVTCVGDPGNFSYLQTKEEGTLVDRITMHTLRESMVKYNVYTYLSRGSDERQYNSPGVNLNIGSLMRSKYGTYPEYHTSLDNLDFITEDALQETLDMYVRCLTVFENNFKYIATTVCEPKLSKYNLYPDRACNKKSKSVSEIVDFLSFCDGQNDLLQIADKLGCSVWSMYPTIKTLLENKLIKSA